MCGKSETQQQLQTTSTNVYFLPLPGEQDLIFAFDLKQDKKSAIKISRPWRETFGTHEKIKTEILSNLFIFVLPLFEMRFNEAGKSSISFFAKSRGLHLVACQRLLMNFLLFCTNITNVGITNTDDPKSWQYAQYANVDCWIGECRSWEWYDLDLSEKLPVVEDRKWKPIW